MKKTLIILVLLFSSSVFAEDISDFQIEGMSIGDSLLDYFDEKKLQTNKLMPSFKNKKFVMISLKEFRKIDKYETVYLWVKDKDKKYIIYSVEGYVYYPNNIQGCYKEQKKIIKEMNEFFKEESIQDNGLRTRPHSGDKSGKSSITETVFWFPSGGRVQISCMDFSKQTEWKDQLSVAIDSQEYSYFLNNEAW